MNIHFTRTRLVAAAQEHSLGRGAAVSGQTQVGAQTIGRALNMGRAAVEKDTVRGGAAVAREVGARRGRGALGHGVAAVEKNALGGGAAISSESQMGAGGSARTLVALGTAGGECAQGGTDRACGFCRRHHPWTSGSDDEERNNVNAAKRKHVGGIGNGSVLRVQASVSNVYFLCLRAIKRCTRSTSMGVL